VNEELPVKRHRGRLVDARLHLLDRQMLNEDDDPVGIVDDLELSGVEIDREVTAGSQAPQVTALLSGRVVATRILGGAPPRSLLSRSRGSWSRRLGWCSSSGTPMRPSMWTGWSGGCGST